MAKKRKKAEARTPDLKICSSCGAENKPAATSCHQCERERFEPDWVLAKAPISRQTSVQVTMSNAAFGEQQKRVTLSKWWPGGRATFHINQPGQWEEIKNAIDTKIAPIIGWTSAKDILKKLSAEHNSKSKGNQVNNLITNHPQVLKEIVAHIDPKKLSAVDFQNLTETLGQISEVATQGNSGFREAFLSVIKKLPTQHQRALEDLDLLLQGWNLNVITNVAQQVKGRLDTIALFEERINDPRTLEIK